MKKTEQRNCDAQIEHAKDRIEQVEERVEQAADPVELAEVRTEIAQVRTELAETRRELAESRAEQAERALKRVIEKEIALCDHAMQPKMLSENGSGQPESALEPLTDRQREILQRIAEGQNTKQIAETLNLSPKTVEYHRAKLMNALNVHDIPGLVRLAVHAGLVPAEIPQP